MKKLALMPFLALFFMGALRPAGETVLFQRLNGVPVKLGTITTTGASTTNATTATAFTLTGGDVLMATCDGAAVLTVGGSASTTYANAAFGMVMSAGVAKYIVLRPGDTSIAVASAASVNCAVHSMQ